VRSPRHSWCRRCGRYTRGKPLCPECAYILDADDTLRPRDVRQDVRPLKLEGAPT